MSARRRIFAILVLLLLLPWGCATLCDCPVAIRAADTDSTAAPPAQPAIVSPATESPPWIVTRAGEPKANTSAVTLPDTRVDHIESKHVGITYKLYVSTPPCPDPCTERFPVVYLLDADYSFAIARNIVEHLADRNGLPRLILVGIAYDYPPDQDRERSYRINRTRDYTPSNSLVGYPKDVQSHSGGAASFLAFLEQELIPYIDRTLPTATGDRTLVGHSYGGLFGTWALLTRPDLFRRAILISPSYWYDDHFMFSYEAARSAELDRLPVRLFLAIGAQEKNSRRDMVGDLQKLATTLASREYEGFEIHHMVLPGEYHDSIFPGALSTGLRTVFRKIEN